MKKSVIAATACFAVGVIGMAVTLPTAIKDGVHLYNTAIQQEFPYQHQEISEEVTELRIINQFNFGQKFIEIRQSPDSKIHFYWSDNPMEKKTVKIKKDGTKAELRIQEEENRDLTLSKEKLIKMLGAELNYQSPFILEVPKTVSITSTENDHVYLGATRDVEFINFDQIYEYGYVPSENESWRLKYEEEIQKNEQLQLELSMLEIDNNSLREQLEGISETNPEVTSEEGKTESVVKTPISPSDIIKMENILSEYKTQFTSGKISRDEYYNNADKMMEKIKEARIEQVLAADHPELTPTIDEISEMQRKKFASETEILSAQKAYSKKEITQSDYNAIVMAYEESLIELNKEITQRKEELSEMGYYWESAFVIL